VFGRKKEFYEEKCKSACENGRGSALPFLLLETMAHHGDTEKIEGAAVVGQSC
jgi:hypothetical protein